MYRVLTLSLCFLQLTLAFRHASNGHVSTQSVNGAESVAQAGESSAAQMFPGRAGAIHAGLRAGRNRVPRPRPRPVPKYKVCCCKNSPCVNDARTKRDGVNRYQIIDEDGLKQCCKQKYNDECGGLFTGYTHQRRGSCAGTPFVLPSIPTPSTNATDIAVITAAIS